jgi:hypothetical protein
VAVEVLPEGARDVLRVLHLPESDRGGQYLLVIDDDPRIVPAVVDVQWFCTSLCLLKPLLLSWSRCKKTIEDMIGQLLTFHRVLKMIR